MPASSPDSITVVAHGKSTTLTLSKESLVVQRQGDKKWPYIETHVRNVLWAELKGGLLEVSLIARGKKSSRLSLVHITGKVHIKEIERAAAFAVALMDVAYTGLKRQRKLKVLVNPKSGPGNAISHYNEKVEPIFHAARCIVDSTFTSHAKHAQELTRELDLDQYDAIVVVSGDGLIHEVVNGFAQHANPERAFRLPITPVPSGSGNGLALNVLGLQDGYDVCAGALNAIKGRPMHIDLCTVTQGDNKTYSFMSQTVGLFADLDLGTEWLRLLGSTRFVIGFVYGVLRSKRCPVKLSIKIPESDKKRMVHKLNAYKRQAHTLFPDTPGSRENGQLTVEALAPETTDHESVLSPATVKSSTPLTDDPEAPFSEPDADGWVTFTRPLCYVYSGKGPYVSRDLMQFPVSIPDDGMIDIVAQEIDTRSSMLRAMDGSERGEHYWRPTQHYFKASAYRVEPYSSDGLLSVDGERYPFATFQVDCHRGMATVLTQCGFYQSEFDLPKESK